MPQPTRRDAAGRHAVIDIRRGTNNTTKSLMRGNSFMKTKQRRGFTLVEVLIVVVIMAVLAATIIPQFSDSTNDAKVSNLKFNLHTLRSQIELYKSQHDGVWPASQDLSELTEKTDKYGTKDANGEYGPYLREVPINPYKESNATVAPAANPPVAEEATGGWLYDTATGELWINYADLLSE
jgi:type II secretion system protein G